MPFAFHYAARSDVGMVRSNNEDSGYAGPHLLAMADGMGGHAGGDVASSTVIGALVGLDGEALGGRDAQPGPARPHPRAPTPRSATRCTPTPASTAWAPRSSRCSAPGDKIVLAHIGDSRAFMVRDGVVTQITKDHSFVQNLVDEGRITADEAQTHPQRSLVTRVLTGAHDDEPDLVVRQGRIGDRYVIASDGLTDYVARDTIDEVLTTTADPGESADRLVALALRAGAPDNVTVVVGDLVDIAAPTARPPSPRSSAPPRRGSGHPADPDDPGRQGRGAHRARPPAGTATPTTGVTLAEEGPRSRRGDRAAARRPARRARRRRRRGLVRRVRVVPAAVLPRRAGRRGHRVPRGRPEPRAGVAVQRRVLDDDRRRRPAAPPTRTASSRASRSTTGRRPTPGSTTCGCRRRPAGGPGPTARRAAPCRRRGPRRPPPRARRPPPPARRPRPRRERRCRHPAPPAAPSPSTTARR